MAVLGIFMSRSDAPGAPISTVAGKFDAAVCDFAWRLYDSTSGGGLFQFTHDIAAGDVTWYHFGMNSDTQFSNEDGYIHMIKDVSGNNIAYFDLNDGAMRLAVVGTSTLYSPQAAMPVGFARYDIKITMTNPGILAEMFVNGSASPGFTISVADHGGRTKPATFVLQSYDSDDTYTSEVYVADFDTRNTRPVKQVPDADGFHSDWTGGWAALGDEDVMTAADGVLVGDKVSVNLDGYPGPASPGGIKAVVIKIASSKGATGPQNLAPFVRIAGTDYSAADLPITEDMAVSLTEFALNPATSLPWSTADLDTTEIGLEAKT